MEPTTPRNYYPLACVAELFLCSDAVARSAEDRTSSENVIRPVVKLAPVRPVSDSDYKFFSSMLVLFQYWQNNWHFLVMKTLAFLVSLIWHVNPKTKKISFMYAHFFVS